MTDKPVVGEAVTGNAKLFARIAELEAIRDELASELNTLEKDYREQEKNWSSYASDLEARLASQEIALGVALAAIHSALFELGDGLPGGILVARTHLNLAVKEIEGEGEEV